MEDGLERCSLSTRRQVFFVMIMLKVWLAAWEYHIFQFKNDIYFPPPPPTPSENDIFPPLATRCFRLPSWPFCLNSSLFCINFTLLLLLSHFLSPVFLFHLYFLPFSLPLFIFFPPNDISWYFPFPPRRGEGIFQYIDPWAAFYRCSTVVFQWH